MENKNLVIIDGSSLVYRAFYALPLLTNKKGMYTNGIYGFLTMLYKLKEQEKIDYIAIAFDKKGPTFRHKMYEDYKGHRAKTPGELSEQLPILKEILRAMNISLLESENYEADDIAGTLAKKAEEEGYKVTLVTGDRDYLQLADQNVRILMTKKGITNMEEYNFNKIVEEYGLKPRQLIEVKGLMGDSSDNIPGVPGIGVKTALKLIQDFKTIDGVYENIDKITGKKRVENLIENKELAYMSRELGKIILDVPLQISLEDLSYKEPNYEKLLEYFTDLEFNSLIKELPKELTKMEKVELEIDYNLVKDNIYKEIMEEIQTSKELIFKILTKEEHYINTEVLAIGLRVNEKNYYLDGEDNDLNKFFRDFKEVFENPEVSKLSHRIKSDIYSLLTKDINISNVAFDTQLAQYILDPSQSNYSIDQLANEYLGIYVNSEEDLLGKGKSKKNFSDLSKEERALYLSTMLLVVDKIREKMMAKIENFNMKELYYNIELPLAEVLASMEYEGFSVDIKVLKDLQVKFEKKLELLTQNIYSLAGEEFNINSPKQLGVVLFEKLDLPVIKKTKTGYSTNVDVLNKLQGKHEIIDYILDYRQMAKLKNTYIDGLINLVDPKTGKIHSTFNQTVTSTGRISSTEPNLQNIPIKTEEGREIRKAFITKGPDYILVDGDYSQIELRVLAHISQDQHLMEAFFENQDVHTKTASQVFHIPEEEVSPLMRNRAKAVNFGIIYGISDYGLSRDLDIPVSEAKSYIDRYLENFSNVQKYMQDIVAKGKENGYVETIVNRRRYIPELESRNYNIRSFGERIALNTPIQGSAADIIKLAMVRVYRELEKNKLKSKLILQVHDELIIETYKDELEQVETIMKKVMEDAIQLKVPLKVDIETGVNWYETM